MKTILFFKNHAKKLTVSISILTFVLIFSIIALPLIISPIAEKQLTKALNREVKIGRISLNPIVLSVQIDSFSIKEIQSKENFLTFDRLYINLQLISLIKRGLIIKDIVLDNPFVSVSRNSDSTYSFSDLIKPSAKKDSSQFNYSLNNIKISGGEIRFADLPKNSHHDIKNLKLSLPFFSNLDYYTDVYFTPSFSAVVNGTPFELKGKTKPFDKSMETEIAININKIDLAKYLEYIPQKLNFNLNSAFFSADGHINFMLKENKKPFLEYSGNLTLDTINLTDTNDSLVLKVQSFNVDVKSAEIVSSSINLNSIMIKEPLLNISREKNGKISILSLLPENKPATTTDKKESVPPNFKLGLLSLENGKLAFTDKIFFKPFKQKVDSINFSLENLSLDKGCQYTLDLVNRSVEKIGISGDLVFNPFAVNGKFSLRDLEPNAYTPYFPANLDVEVKNGIVDFQTDYHYNKINNEEEISFSNSTLNIRDLNIWQKSAHEEIFRNKLLTLTGVNFDLNQNSLSLDSVKIDKGRINVKLLPDGKINLSSLIKDTADTSNQQSVEKTPEDPFSFMIKNFKLSNYQVQFKDLTTFDKDSLSLNQINLTLKDLSNRKGSQGKIQFSAALLPLGHLGAYGTATLEPLCCNLKLDFKNISLKPAQAYLSDKLNITLTGGDLTLLGKLDFAQNTGSPLKADFSGNVGIKDFSTINKENADNFLLWKDLKFQNLDFSLDPFKINIKEINVSELYSLFNIYADGTTNLQAVLKKDSTIKVEQVKSDDTTADEQKPVDDDNNIHIESIILDNCNINFSDYRFKNVFSANMKNLNGKVTGLSSEQDVVADVAVDGKYDATSPIIIAGKVNPLAKNLFVDIGLSFKDIDLTQMNPYSQKYLGYAIRKGKLSLDLKYFVKDKKLDSKNNVFINQLTLGESVESPDATHLPVRFALALIRDRNGDINLDVPITGSLDDPKFNVGKLLLHVLSNIVTKAVTSPFSALGSLFGGGEELSYLEFEPGSSNINSQSLGKLDKISKGLIEREDLTVEIQGFADLTKDREGFKKYSFERKLKTSKLKDLLKKSDKNIIIDSVYIQSEEYEKYLRKVYNTESFDKPKNTFGLPKSLPITDMEKLVYDNIAVNDNDLKTLAATRALKVKEYLLNVKKINSAKVFLIEAKKISPESKTDIKDSRVEFVLKAD